MIDPLQKLLGEFVRITTKDGLELHGLLFEPKIKTTRALIHVHGWTGNFYENAFIDYIANQAISKGYAFLTFNNRGAGMVQDFTKRNKFKAQYKKIGGSLEKFEDCLLDIKAAADFLEGNWYMNLVFQGHSLGCQKITFYQYKIGDKRVKGLILLAPVDDVGFTKKDLKDRYQEALIIAKELVEKKRQSPVPEWMAFSPMLSAEVFLNIADPESLSGRIFDYSGKLQEIKNVNCLILSIFGSNDEYETHSADKLKILRKNVENCVTKLIEDSNHGFVGYENKLSQIVGEWLEELVL